MNMHTQSGAKRVYIYTKDTLNRLEKLIAVGDIHGDIDALNSLLDYANPSRDGIIFLGDYADRGPCGVEVIESVEYLIEKYPENVVALKGNHEDYVDGEPKFMPCTLIQEAKEKRGDWDSYFKEELKQFFDRLYLAAIIPGWFLFVHGGISSKIASLEDFENPKVEEDVLWSDPFDGFGEYKNRRGAGVEFGEDITEKVCKRLGIKRIIRSHQPRKALDGPFYQHNNKIVTISSTSVYGGRAFVYVLNPHDLRNVSYQFL